MLSWGFSVELGQMGLRSTHCPMTAPFPRLDAHSTDSVAGAEGAHGRAGAGGRGGADGGAARGRADAAGGARAGVRRARPARRRVRRAGAAAGRGRATTAATRCTPGRCWPGAVPRSRRCCSRRTGRTRRGLAALRGAGGRVVTAAEATPRPDVVVDGIVGHRRPAAGCGRRGGRGAGAAAPASRSWPSTCRRASTSTPASSTGRTSTAALTVTFGTHKVAHLVDPAAAGVRRRAPRRPRPRRCPRRPVEALQAADVAPLLPGPTRSAHKYTRGVVGVRAGSAAVPRRRACSRVAGAGCGLAGMVRYVGDAAADRCAPRTPRWSAPAGSRPGWSAPAAATRRPAALAGALADGVPVVVDADALAALDGPARRAGGAHPARRRARRGCSAPTGRTSRRARCAHARDAARAVRRRGAAQGPAHARRRARTAGSGSTPPACPGWPPPAPATCWAAWSAPCSPPGWTPLRRRVGRAPGCTAPPRPWPRRAVRCVAADVARGAPGRGAEPASGRARRLRGSCPMTVPPSARAEIVVDLDAIRHNVRAAGGPRRHRPLMMTVVKADGYGHGMVECGPRRPRGGRRLARRRHPRRGAGAAGGRRHRAAAVLADVPGEDYAAALAADVDVTAYTVAELDEIAAAAGRAGPGRAGPAQGRHRALPRRRGAGRLGRPGRARRRPRGDRRADGHRRLVALRLQRRAGAPGQRRAGGGVPRGARVAEEAGLRPEVRHLANSAAAILRPSSRFDLVRCGIASYGLDPAPGPHPRPRPAPGDDRARPLALTKPIAAGAGVSYGHTWIADARHDRRPGPGRVRRRGAAARRQPRRGLGRRTPPADPRPDLHGPVRRRPRRRPARARRRGGAVRSRRRRRAHRPGLGRGLRHHQLRDRHPDRQGRMPRRYVDDPEATR